MVSVGDDRWEIYVGGAAGAHVRKGDLLATVVGAEEVLRVAGLFIQHYRETAGWLERTYAWVPRVGLETLQRTLIDDADGIAEGLAQRMQTSVDGYRDPWQDRAEPKSPAQFTPSLPLLPLPRVPVR